jgi:prepilin-type N-terminal cleavage/methylation domain-containing protein
VVVTALHFGAIISNKSRWINYMDKILRFISACKKQAGFTLIEILFVIAILGVIAALGMSLTTQRTQKFKVEKAALQLQQMLQAGMTFYSDNKNTWPNDCTASSTSIDCCDEISANKFCPYLPQWVKGTASGAYPVNPWGNRFYWQKVAASATVSNFQVSIVTPSAVVAQQLAALLPNAKVTGSTISTMVSPPSSGGGGSSTIVGFGTFPDSSKPPYGPNDFDGQGNLKTSPSVSVSCPSNTTASLMAYPVVAQVGTGPARAQVLFNLSLQPKCDPPGSSSVCTIFASFQSLNRDYSLHPAVIAEGASVLIDGKLVIGYIAFCMSNS